ncbi:MAG: hypothetical protein KDC84_12820 [Crocinitomicaceae bacterium]|nr:hypothetical protein [Crocinitomicaceae bacterium]
MYKSILSVLVSLLFLASCNKEKFPEQDQIVGNWVHHSTEYPPIRIEFNANGYCYFQRTDTSQYDTLTYQVDTENEKLLLSPALIGSSFSPHDFQYNKKEDKLRIGGLTSQSLAGSSVHLFERED